MYVFYVNVIYSLDCRIILKIENNLNLITSTHSTCLNRFEKQMKFRTSSLFLFKALRNGNTQEHNLSNIGTLNIYKHTLSLFPSIKWLNSG